MGVQNPDQCSPKISDLMHSPPITCDNYCSSPPDPDNTATRRVESSSAQQCLEFASQIDHSKDYESLYQQIEGLQRLQSKQSLQRLKSKQKIKSHGSGGSKINTEKHGEDVCTGREACYCAVSFAADSAAICCCPCALLHLMVLAFVRVPSAFARKAFYYAKKKGRSNAKSEHNKKKDDDFEKKREKWSYYTPPWSCIASPQTSGPLERSLTSKLDNDKVWSELYAAGHLGFGGDLS